MPVKPSEPSPGGLWASSLAFLTSIPSSTKGFLFPQHFEEAPFLVRAIEATPPSKKNAPSTANHSTPVAPPRNTSPPREENRNGERNAATEQNSAHKNGDGESAASSSASSSRGQGHGSSPGGSAAGSLPGRPLPWRPRGAEPACRGGGLRTALSSEDSQGQRNPQRRKGVTPTVYGSKGRSSGERDDPFAGGVGAPASLWSPARRRQPARGGQGPGRPGGPAGVLRRAPGGGGGAAAAALAFRRFML